MVWAAGWLSGCGHLVAVLIKLNVECDYQVDKLGVVIKVVTWVWIMWSLCGDQCDHCVVIKFYADIGPWLFATPCGAHSPRWSLVFIHTIISPHGHFYQRSLYIILTYSLGHILSHHSMVFIVIKSCAAIFTIFACLYIALFQAIGHVCEECGIILTGELFTLHGRVLCEEDFKVWMIISWQCFC